MRVAILGAGMTGLSCAWLLAQQEVDVTVFEKRPYVGGLARSFQWHGFNCDFATHRLFTQDENVLRQMLSLVPMGRHIRRSRIYMAGKWIRDPINIVDVLYQYFPRISLRVIFDFFNRPRYNTTPDSFESYVLERYGARLHELCLKPYTEKLFGIPANEVSVEWAHRKVRIGGPLDILRESSKKHFSYFYYPLQGGYGAIPDRLYRDVRDRVKLNCTVLKLSHCDSHISGITYEEDGQLFNRDFDVVISTLPVTVLGRMLNLDVCLSYRKVDAVYLLVNQPLVSDNHWVYFIDRDNAINRMVEFKNLSSVDCPQSKTVLCAEVTNNYPNIVDKVVDDIVESTLVDKSKILDTMVKREVFSYPVYNRYYPEVLGRAQTELSQYSNLYTIGRSAEFEHQEIDDCFAGATQLITQICNLAPTVISGYRRSAMMSAETTSPPVYAIILTYNHYEDTIECLESLQEIDYDNLSIVVVDNGSSDNTPTIVRERFADVHIIETGSNLGVPWGYNVGFSYALRAGAEYILMLNNDTIVATDILRHLVEAGQADPEAGILMPKVLYYDEPNVVWAVGGRYRLFPPAIVILGQNKRESDLSDSPQFIEYALSCGLLIHRRAFEKAGLFDPGYFFQFDDWDFSQRVRAHGLHIQLVPAARMWHKVSRTTRQEANRTLFWKVWGESSVRFYRRHGRPAFLSVPIHVGYIMFREMMKGNRRMLKHYWAGVRAGLAKPLGPIPSASDTLFLSAQVETL